MSGTELARPRRGTERSAMAALVPLFSLKQSITNAIKDFLKKVFEALVTTLVDFFSGLIKEFLFFPRPSEVSGLNGIQEQTLVVFLGLLLVGWLAFLLDIQIFPYNTNSDPYRLLERSFAGMVMVVAGPMVIDYGVVLTSAIGDYLYPTDLGEQLTSIVMANPGGSLVAIALVLTLGTTLILVVAAFFVVLALRMFLVYVAFALLPLFAAFWIFDTGVGKYTKKTADTFFKTTAMILVAGILIAAILNVGVTVATVDTTAVTDAGAAGGDCLDGMSVEGTCILKWSQLFAFIGIGGAMTVSTTVAMLGVGTLMGGGVGSVAGGAVGGLAAGAVGKAKSAAVSGSGGAGGQSGTGGPDSRSGTGGTGGPDPAEGAGGAPMAQLESPDSYEAGAGSVGPRADLGGAGGAAGATVAAPSSGGVQAGGQSRRQQDKSLYEKTKSAAAAGSGFGGAVSAVDPTMGAATAAVTAAAGAYQFRKEGGFSDVKQATMDAGKTVGRKVGEVKSSLNSVSDPTGHREESNDESGLGGPGARIDYGDPSRR